MVKGFKGKLVVKRNKILLLLMIYLMLSCLLLLIGPYEKTRALFESNFILACTLTLFFVLAIVFLIVRYSNNKPKMIINKIGILTKENEIIEWGKISSIEARKNYDEHFTTSIIKMTLKESDSAMKIDTTFLKPDLQTIMVFMKKVNTNEDIIFTSIDK